MNTILNKYTRLAVVGTMALAMSAAFAQETGGHADVSAVYAEMKANGLVTGSMHATQPGQLTLTDAKEIAQAKKNHATLRDATKVTVTDKFLALPESEKMALVEKLANAGNGSAEISAADCAAPVITRTNANYTGDESNPTIIRNKFEELKVVNRGDAVKFGPVTFKTPCVPEV